MRKSTQKEILYLENIYKDRKPYFGELHDHASTGGTSDGQRTLTHWKAAMEALKIDFATILDHKQVRHMYLPEWEDGVFVGGTEPGTYILDSKATYNGIHYNMVFAKPEQLENVLNQFKEFKFEGGKDGHFIYPKFTTERFCELIKCVKENDGFFVHPHPKSLMISEDPNDYWFVDETGIEVFYNDYKNKDSENNYKLWTDLLSNGKRVWACAGGDGHCCASNLALTTIYAEEKTNESYLAHLTKGDFVCGFVGIRMCIGNTTMGGNCSFNNKLIVCINDFHPSVLIKGHQYSVRIINENGMLFKRKLSVENPNYFTINVEKSKFYRVEVYDETSKIIIAIGNPIWNND